MASTYYEKSSIAWFKLSELVARREKERAISIFRLLSHSLADSAYMFLLEAEVLAAFGDPKAVESFLKAAALYAQEGRWELAYRAYELVVCSGIGTPDCCIQPVIECLQSNSSHGQVKVWGARLFRIWCEQGYAFMASSVARTIDCPLPVRLAWLDMIMPFLQKQQPASAHESEGINDVVKLVASLHDIASQHKELT